MASLRRSKTLSPDGQTARFLYTIIKQLDLKTIDWNEVASGLDITNGHAARMRFSRFKQHIEGIPTQTRGPRSKKDIGSDAGKRVKGKKSVKRSLQEENDEVKNEMTKEEEMDSMDTKHKKVKSEGDMVAKDGEKMTVKHNLGREIMDIKTEQQQQQQLIKTEKLEDTELVMSNIKLEQNTYEEDLFPQMVPTTLSEFNQNLATIKPAATRPPPTQSLPGSIPTPIPASATAAAPPLFTVSMADLYLPPEFATQAESTNTTTPFPSGLPPQIPYYGMQAGYSPSAHGFEWNTPSPGMYGE